MTPQDTPEGKNRRRAPEDKAITSPASDKEA